MCIMPLMKSLLRSLAFCFVLYMLAIPLSHANAQGTEPVYYPETGHNIQGDFLRFYNAAADPLTLYGYPITDQFTEPDGLLVQYFQRARFEYHPELSSDQHVILTDVGSQMYTPSIQLNLSSPLACRYYSQTNFSVCLSFLDFYDKYGGPLQFGYPISPFEYHDGLIVQYFQKARMEWRPSNPEGQRVVLTDLGSLFFDKEGEDPAREAPLPPLNASIQPQIISLQVSAFVQKAITSGSDQQTIFIIVNDQNGQPLGGAKCDAAIQWPNESNQVIAATTNSSGIGIIRLSFANRQSGSFIPINVNCQYESEVSGSTTTSFRIWY